MTSPLGLRGHSILQGARRSCEYLSTTFIQMPAIQCMLWPSTAPSVSNQCSSILVSQAFLCATYYSSVCSISTMRQAQPSDNYCIIVEMTCPRLRLEQEFQAYLLQIKGSTFLRVRIIPTDLEREKLFHKPPNNTLSAN